MQKKKWTLEDLPKVNSQGRRMLLDISTYPEYGEDLGRGLPFFSEEELKEIEGRYKDGMTRKDILTEAYKKGWPLKESTLKSYMQKDQLPRPLKRSKTSKGMISIYPANMIRHLNFVRYCLFSGNKATAFLLQIIKEASISDLNRLEEASVELDPGLGGEDCIHSLWIGLDRLESGLTWTEESIEKAFIEYPPKRQQYMQHVSELKEIRNQLEKKVSELQEILKNTLTQMDLGKAFLTPTKEEEV